MLDINKFEEKFTDKNWWVKLQDFFKTKRAFEIYQFLKQRSKDGKEILPKSDVTFRAFNECKFKDLKLILIGQEPYASVFNKVPAADGLAFSNENQDRMQPSLEYLWHSIKNNYDHVKPRNSLQFLANQGMLLLNYSLTVEKNVIGAHIGLQPEVFATKNLWEYFIKYLLEEVMYGTSGIVYVLMGTEAKKAKRFINPLGNYILETDHSSFHARQHNDDWDADKVWLKANRIIEANLGQSYTIEYDYDTYLLKKELENKDVNELTQAEMNVLNNGGDLPF